MEIGKVCVFLSGVALTAFSAPHVLEPKTMAHCPEEGLLIGNGDLSCSVYRESNRVVFRLGKGDVWDRRLDLSRDARPATIREIRRGVLDEGWKVNPYDGKGTVATKGTKDEKRMREICNGNGRGTQEHPFPEPKPTGELRLFLPGDWGEPEVVQRLTVEEARLQIGFRWRNGMTADVEAVIPPRANVLSLAWCLDAITPKDAAVWNNAFRHSSPLSLGYGRHADPRPDVWRAKEAAVQVGTWCPSGGEWDVTNSPPLPPPVATLTKGGAEWVEQSFYPDLLFPDGFKVRLTGRASASRGAMRPRALDDDAWILHRMRPGETAGEFQLAVTTSRDRTLAAAPFRSHADYRRETVDAARAYWAKSSLRVPGDPALEGLWYATYHARRAILRGGTVPPGLFFPSTVHDHSIWHGDYHSNYNLQSIYWGDYTANRLDTAEAYFDAVDFFVPVGRKIARDYYGGRGVFIQLYGFPLLAADDYSGVVPGGRMAYMTGWVAGRYWEHWQYTRDRAWLAERGYPFIRDAALFYLDFLLKAPHEDLPPELHDGLYHAFPSIAGEDGFSGRAMDLCDRNQVMHYARFALYAAVRAAKALGVDADLQAEWQERLDKLATVRHDLRGYERHCYECCVPQSFFPTARPYVRPPTWTGRVGRAVDPTKGAYPEAYHTWYPGHTIGYHIGILRGGDFVTGRDWPVYRRVLERYRHDNGLVWAMSVANLGWCGAWTETLSCMAPVQEMMLQSWDGAIRLFPYWEADATFENWRAQGAFLVSASRIKGRIRDVTVTSEKGEDCLVHGAWTVTDAEGRRVATDRDEFGRLRFKTSVGGRYVLDGPPAEGDGK